MTSERNFRNASVKANVKDSGVLPRDGDRRSFKRIFFDAETVLVQNEQTWVVQLLDISFEGILVQLLPEQSLDHKQAVQANIHLGGDIQIRMTLSIVHQEGLQLGLHCENIDLDSLTHLRRLVEVNLGDSALLEREFARLRHD